MTKMTTEAGTETSMQQVGWERQPGIYEQEGHKESHFTYSVRRELDKRQRHPDPVNLDCQMLVEIKQQYQATVRNWHFLKSYATINAWEADVNNLQHHIVFYLTKQVLSTV